jgi:putative DNA primase/helicase
MTARDPLPHDERAGICEDDADLVFGPLPRKPLQRAERLAEIAEAQERTAAAIASWVGEGGTTSPFALVPIADLYQTDPAPPTYAWQGLIPMGHVTGLAAHGGTGKSVVAIVLAVSVAVGRPLFGESTRRGPVVLFSGEDGKALLRYRLKFICSAMNVDVADLEGKLHILDATEGDPTLFAELNVSGQRMGKTTSTYAALRAFCRQQKAVLLIVDNASDAFDANENDRARVRAFMRALASIARDCESAVLLLAHVDKGTSKQERNGAEAYSGSTAWHNSARSRLFMRRESDGSLVIEHQKNNLGPLHAPIRLHWPATGIPEVAEPFGPHAKAQGDYQPHEKWLLRLIAEYSARGEHITTATHSRTHAARVLRSEPGFPKWLKDAEVFDLLRNAERAGYLQRAEIRGANRHRRECWQVTPAGVAFAAVTAPPDQEAAF